MEKNNFQHLSANEFDQLMNRAFLDLDFAQPKNQKLMESISERTLTSTNPFALFNKILIKKLILFVSACILADGISSYVKKTELANTRIIAVSELAARLVEPGGVRTEPLPIQQNSTQGKRIPVKRMAQETVSTEMQEKIILTGMIKSARTGGRLKGAAVYKLNSPINTTSTDLGHFSLELDKGENSIGVSLAGYQTFTFSFNSNQDVAKNIELREVWKALAEVVVRPGDYIFPVLTEKEKKANGTEKRKMARLAARMKQVRDKREDKYPFIPSPPDQAFGAFNMGNVEVTNLEYRTFLFDLLIQGKKEEFLIAKPEQNLWKHAGGQELFDTLVSVYFSQKHYNIYPVVNISVTGAQMYCSWLSDLANEIRRNEGKPEISLRLPNENEWLYAASGGHPGAVYPWPLDSIQNRVNWFLANCCIQKLSDKLKHPLGHFRKGDTTAYTSAGMVLGNKKIATIEAYSYNPNEFSLYGMCGNASELVFADKSRLVKAKGGNWNSDFEHLKLNSEEEFTGNIGPSPMIGFRVCADIKKSKNE